MKYSSIAAIGALVVLSYTTLASAAEQARYRLIAIGSLDTSTFADAMSANGKVTGGYTPGGQPDVNAFLFSHGTLTGLGILGGGTYSAGVAVNSDGQVAGEYLLADGSLRGFIYSRGASRDLGTLGGSSNSPVAINERGQVTGSSALAGDVFQRAYRFGNHGLADLGTLGGDFSVGSAINDRGQVAGTASLAGGGNLHAFLYSHGSMVDLGDLGGGFSTAGVAGSNTQQAMNNKGEVVGWSFLSDYTFHGFLYTHGSMLDLGTLGGQFSVAVGVNANSQVTGYASLLGDAEVHGFLYSRGVMSDLGTLGGSTVFPSAMNDDGEVTGNATTAGDIETHAFLYRRGAGMRDLNNLIPASATASGFYLANALAISDAGAILAEGSDGAFYLLTVRERVTRLRDRTHTE